VEIAYQLYQLAFKHPFTLATGTRTHTPSVLVKIKQDHFNGYGEATLPPYLYETQQSVIDFISQVQISDIKSTSDFENTIDQIQKPPLNFFAKAALDIALHDLWAKMNNISVSRLINIGNEKTPYCTYTIGMGSPEKIKEKIKEAEGFHILKVKLGGENDRQIIETIRKSTDKPICVDANQGWKQKEDALEMIDWLATKNVLFIEQPLPKDQWDNAFWLKEKSPLPVIADEALQTLADLDKASKCYHGINIKLMKCGGISQAKLLIEKAKALHLKILIGCMSESSCGVAAAASTQSEADWVDLDGPLLISNDPFEKTNYVDGKIILNNIAGLGITAKNDINYSIIQ
jgi:L-Ala-D/L-Glu epimerase